MKRELDTKFTLPCNFDDFPDEDFLTLVGGYVLRTSDAPEEAKINVSKCWVNNITYGKMKAKMLAELTTLLPKAIAERNLGMHELCYGFACDHDDMFDIPDDIIVVEHGALLVEEPS